MDWHAFMRIIEKEKRCPTCRKKLNGLSSLVVKEHLKIEHPKEMLDLFENMTGCHHYCPFHRGDRHRVSVTCSKPICPECENDLETWRINFTAGWIATMSLARSK